MPKFDNETQRIRVGVEVPPSGVNLAHYYCPPLTPIENVIIGDNSGFIIENTQQQQSTLMNGNINNLLEHEDGETSIDSELVEVTDKFYGDIPLYYRYKLTKLFCGERKGIEGTYYGQSIQVVDYYNNKLPKSMAYKIVLDKATTKVDEHNAYDVYIYTSFQIENNYRVKCVYNSLELNKYDEWVVVPNDEEIINPQVFFLKAHSILEAITESNKYYLEKSIVKIKSSNIYTKGVFLDPRTPHKIKVKLSITLDDGTTSSFTYPKDYNGEDFYEVYNIDSAIHDELSLFKNNRMMLTSKSISEITLKDNIVSVKAEVLEADREPSSIRLFVRPDGTGRLYAETFLDTGIVSNIPDKHFKKIGEYISIGYSIRFKDRNPIKLLQPREEGSLNQWYVRVQNGRFIKQDEDATYYYYIPEYYKQLFDKDYGFPYKKITEEIPTVISRNAIKVRHTPLYVDQKEGELLNIKVYRIDANGNRWPMFIESWNDKDGIITLIDIISENDNIYVDYMFEEESYPYRGFVKYNSYNAPAYALLDVNPNQHHFMTDTTSTVYTDVSTFRLINQTIYFYIKPAIINRNGVMTYNDAVLEHSIEEYSVEYLKANHMELIGIIYVRPNSSQFSLAITDARTRGGGVIEEINDNLRRKFEPESDFYWDIGYWDGEPYNENSVIIIRLDKRLLVQFGGRFTEDEISIAVNKHIAIGTYPIIEYVTNYSDDSLKIKNLEISKVQEDMIQ